MNPVKRRRSKKKKQKSSFEDIHCRRKFYNTLLYIRWSKLRFGHSPFFLSLVCTEFTKRSATLQTFRKLCGEASESNPGRADLVAGILNSDHSTHLSFLNITFFLLLKIKTCAKIGLL